MALVVGGVEELTGDTDWHAAVGLRGGARSQGSATGLTILATSMQALGPVGAHRAGLALASEAQLLSIRTVVTTLVL